MLRPEEVTRVLRQRGQLWETTSGLIGLRGTARELLERIACSLAELAEIGRAHV